MKRKKELKKQLNLNYLNYTNKTLSFGELGLPRIVCNTNFIPDYIALYSQPCEYYITKRTCVAFYDYDIKFNGKDGLFNAIYYDDKKLLKIYKERLKDVKVFIMPDLTLAGDLQNVENYYRMFQQRVISIWLILECKAVVIQNIGVANEKDLQYMLENLDDVSVMALSTKGKVSNKANRKLLCNTIKYMVDNLPTLKRIIVYDVCKDSDNALDICQYALDKKIEIVIPNNILKKRNTEKYNTGKLLSKKIFG